MLHRSFHGSAALAVLLTGCGYSFVRADSGGPVPELVLGVIRDLSTEGDLGQRVARALHVGLAGRGSPRFVDATSGAPRLEGEVELLPERPIAFDALGAGFELTVRGRLELTAAESRTPWPLWSSGPVDRRALYARGGDALATESNRRMALEGAVSDLATGLLERLTESPELVK